MTNNNLQNQEIINAFKKDLENVQQLKESNPKEYAIKLREYVDSLKEFNQSVKNLLDLTE